MKSFDDICEGDKVEFEVLIDENIHSSFAKISGDFSPIHTNDKFSEKTRFKKRIGYGFLLTSFLSRMYGEYLSKDTSVCLTQESKFLKPYFIGDKIKIQSTIIFKGDLSRTMEIKTEMFNQNSIKIYEGVGKIYFNLE